jgi:hypothetical protein
MLLISTSTDFSNCRFSTFITVNNVPDSISCINFAGGSFEKKKIEKIEAMRYSCGNRGVCIPAPLVAV